MWALLGLTLAMIIFAERRSLASIGLHAPTWRTVAFAIGAAAFLAATGPVIFPLLTRSSADYSARLAMVEGWPLGLLLFAALTSGVEEVLYRGYAIERLKEITGSYLLAAGIALAIFGFVHVPFWGRGPLLWFIYAGGVFTVVYLWTHDLAACILAHILADLKALAVDPLVRRRVALRLKREEQET